MNININENFIAKGRYRMDKIDSILEKYDYNRQLLIAIMQDVQKEYHYLPEEILSYIA